MREVVDTSEPDPTMGEIYVGPLDIGTGQQRKLHGDMHLIALTLLDSGKAGETPRGARWPDAVAQLEAQSGMQVNTTEFQEVIRELEQEGLVRVTGKRIVRRVEEA